ncbi:hypothetical protein H113_03096 [Trichophyton rubrum MR1459]|uniref:Uncharacterized protein n=1 Tax=Trichophyton rubrum (strain ATCC MYA-4607 / CBS 118892) TaxID=559305 RepID=A0A080WMF9_TRIRC|nr:uncharacterized protein TERG_12327 [Trichophyton rubrum CBS 118892]EZF96769.1 hypothetical protein H113_03096 [Trichophyton rubrum MR1459]EZG07641.1 hypothetical protein H106_02927 [Trichophyton rubrum CBS 735.88]KFL62042.1 hypothetical protein TERG_12327 [Trichophyton rubrum CBS 118892]
MEYTYQLDRSWRSRPCCPARWRQQWYRWRARKLGRNQRHRPTDIMISTMDAVYMFLRRKALTLSLPAATAKKTPPLAIAAAASLEAWEKAPPRDMLATALSAPFCWASLVAHSIPMMTPELEPEPLQSRTFTATTLLFLATPKVLPPMVPET